MMCTLCAFIVDAAPRLTDSEITRYTLLCSGSLTGQTKSTRPASVDIGGPLETSVCTFRCREMVINPDAHWQTLEELVHEVAINSGTECEMRVITFICPMVLSSLLFRPSGFQMLIAQLYFLGNPSTSSVRISCMVHKNDTMNSVSMFAGFLLTAEDTDAQAPGPWTCKAFEIALQSNKASIVPPCDVPHHSCEFALVVTTLRFVAHFVGLMYRTRVRRRLYGCFLQGPGR
eukprot:Protomagalhaensia_sp_Gyna_25__5846@NODE_873_length_2484_cov_69_643763_g688_i0_p2_GENE_NODE_873_length_2484_cov_69_643763_g688_i0NODE_873_length_2484_cov_69_643763_g688_i0_p2_ORF_typecomplete_len231_score3_43_NODE_873_length_2484_cov_69_643763_g688_i04561148